MDLPLESCGKKWKWLIIKELIDFEQDIRNGGHEKQLEIFFSLSR